MLQRAASNAYSWWWASHIRTKQSKWLEQSLQDMEETVQIMQNLIAQEGDSFAKRAEMYYKRRPELLCALDESYRVFKALADRYDLLSKELQNANHTIATVFPEQVQLSMENDDEDCQLPPPALPKPAPPDQPENIPKAPVGNLKGLITASGKKFQVKKAPPSKEGGNNKKVVAKSGLRKEEAVKEIENMNKEILALQTVKEFVKSSYESGQAKYREIENRILAMHDKVSVLQDEFDAEVVIEDDEAQILMAEAALKSCEQTLSALQEKQESFAREAEEGQQKIESALNMLDSFKHDRLKDQTDESKESMVRDLCNLSQEENANHTLGSLDSLSAIELAEKIDELTSKVISLETAVLSQTALVGKFRTESDDLHEQICVLKGEKERLIGDEEELKLRVRELEDKLSSVQELSKNVESQNRSLRTEFVQAQSNLNHLSERLNIVKSDKEGNHTLLAETETRCEDGVQDEIERCSEQSIPKQDEERGRMAVNKSPSKFCWEEPEDDAGKAAIAEMRGLLNKMDEREMILLQEILKKYKDVSEKKEEDNPFDAMLQVKELKEAIVKRDHEIQSLREQLNVLQGNMETREVGSHLSKPESGSETLDIKEEHNNPDEDGEHITKLTNRRKAVAINEEEIQMKIGAIQDEKLDFWLRFSTACHEVHKFKSGIQDLHNEISKLKEKKQQEGVTMTQLRSEARPHYKHLKEIQTELNLWLEQSASLKNELQRRFSSLCSIEDEITGGFKEEEIEPSNYQAAKFQGEISNMKQENNKIREELETRVDCVGNLQGEIEKALKQLHEEFGISSDRSKLQQSLSKARIPLRSFIFGTKPKKHRHSLFSFMNTHR